MPRQTLPTLSPMLGVPNSQDAAAFYCRVFGGEKVEPWLTTPDGMCVHGEVRIGNALIMLCDLVAGAAPSPKDLGDTTVRLSLLLEGVDTEDIDAVFAKAVENGAEVLIEPSDQFYGQRAGRLRDPFGHVWVIGQPIEDVSTEEMQKRMTALFSGQG